MPNSAEHKTLIACNVELVREVADDVVIIAAGLLAKDLISSGKAASMGLAKPNNEKASELVRAVVDGQIRNNPRKFDIFLDVLSEFEHLSSLVELLESTFESELESISQVIWV